MDDFKMSLCSVRNLLASFAALIIAIIDILITNACLDKEANEGFWDNGIHYILVFNIIFLIVCTFLAFWSDFLYKHQGAVGVLLFVITVVCTFSWLHFGLEICAFPDIDPNIRKKLYLAIIAGAYFVSFSINGFIEWRQYKRFISNDNGDTHRKLPKPVFDAIWITLLILEFITLGYTTFNSWYVGIVGAAVLPRATIVTAHAAYLKWTDKKYWEEVPVYKPPAKATSAGTERKKRSPITRIKRITVLVCIITIVLDVALAAEKASRLQRIICVFAFFVLIAIAIWNVLDKIYAAYRRKH